MSDVVRGWHVVGHRQSNVGASVHVPYTGAALQPGQPMLDSLTGIVLHSDTPLTGTFECSNPLINQLQHNIVWGQKGNFIDVPTDCPQRDERLGWAGDAQVFIRTACFNMNVAAFFTKSWLYPVKKGATTIWERWDGIKPDGSFQDPAMNSFNHYAYGAIGEWLYRVVAGMEVDPVEPGYKHVLFQPQPGGGLTYARATLNSPYGLVASVWELTEADFQLSITVPPNAYATVRLPAQSLDAVAEGGHPMTTGNGILSAQVAGDVAIIEVGSGNYKFVCQ